jgi:polyisoprenoid-binding protein YceI
MALATAAALAGTARATEKYRVSGAEVVIICPLTVGGSFEARTKHVSGEIGPATEQPGAMSGALQVNLQTLQTGIGMRDRHMRENYLEVQKGPEFAVATFEHLRIERLEGKTSFRGTLLLHGQRKEVTGTAELRQQDGRISVQAQFPLRVSEFLISAPSYLGVGVRDEVHVKVTMTVVTGPATLSASAR